jgi:hypothetical protein
VGILLPVWVLSLTYMRHHLWPFKRKLGIAAYAFAGFALVMSMPHLAEGYGLLGLHWWECWALAIVTETAQELELLVITTADRSEAWQRNVMQAAMPAVKRQRKKLARSSLRKNLLFSALAFNQGREQVVGWGTF